MVATAPSASANLSAPKSVAAVARMMGNHSGSSSCAAAQMYGHAATPGHAATLGHASIANMNIWSVEPPADTTTTLFTRMCFCISGKQHSRPIDIAAELAPVTPPRFAAEKLARRVK